MANIFSDGFESGDTTAWSYETDTESDLNVTVAAALHGNYGLAALIDNTTAMNVTDTTSSAETRYRIRFYVDPNTLTMADTKEIVLFYSADSAWALAFDIRLRMESSNYTIKVIDRADGAYIGTGAYTITDAPHCIEVDWKASSAAEADDGEIKLWIDGVLKETYSNIDSDTASVDLIQFGATAVNTDISGTFYVDDFVSNDDGTLIGQISENAIIFGCNF